MHVLFNSIYVPGFFFLHILSFSHTRTLRNRCYIVRCALLFDFVFKLNLRFNSVCYICDAKQSVKERESE